MKKLFVSLSILYAINAYSQDYYISFSGAGESSSVSTVSVENLTAGTSLVMKGSDILHLTNIVTGNHSTEYSLPPRLRIYPNPVTDNSTLEICPPESGNAVISILDMSGRPVARIQSYLENTKQSFRLSGIKNGFYLINVRGNKYQFSAKLLSGGSSSGTARIEKLNSIIQTVEEKPRKAEKGGTLATVDMAYTPGDRLKFTGTSGNYSTVKIDIPTSDKTISFTFYPCTDGNNNNYPVVEIGNQVWMAENLKTTKYSNGSPILLVSDYSTWATNYAPAYCWYNNNESIYNDKYGALYNFYTISQYTSDNKNVCPTGWHVPTLSEWDILSKFLGGQGLARKMKETGTAHWISPNNDATNELGFTAVPGGSRDYFSGAFSGIGTFATWWTSMEDRHSLFEYPATGIFCDLVYDGILYEPETAMRNAYSIRCLMGNSLPIITTSSVSEITLNTALFGGTVISDGSSDVLERGVCWSTTTNPTINDNKLKDLTGSGTFTSSITGLTPGTTYYGRAYATNIAGITYGNQVIFSTKITDIDDNTYNTITIGTQLWLAENLKTTKFNDGTSISLVTDITSWSNLSTPGYCWFNNDKANYSSTYGALYNWFTINTGKLCPIGWHIPTDADWTMLSTFLGGENITGGKLKEAGITHWQSPNLGATNESGFTALPGGNRTDYGTFYNIGNFGYWWSASESGATLAWLRYLVYNYSTVNSVSYEKKSGFSVRCLKDDYPDLTTESITSVTSATANSGGNITSEGSGPVIARGVCWSTSQNPTIAGSKTINGSGTGPFTSSINGLSPNTTYYVRAYATNSVGTNYGNELILKTYIGTVTDIDGNIYNTVTIGTQVWFVENLKTTKYNDDTAIPLVTDSNEWAALITPGYCWYNNDAAAYKSAYGALYNWYTLHAASNGGKNACPTGWHVPSDDEWTTLANYLGHSGNKLKEAGETHWQSPNVSATNESGFTALPGGMRFNFGPFYNVNKTGIWWSSTEDSTVYPASAKNLYLMNYSSEIDKGVKDKDDGLSVRCLKDN